MGSKLIIKDLDPLKLDRVRIKCLDCNYWFDFNQTGFFEDLFKIKSIPEIKAFLSNKIFERNRREPGQRNIESFLCHGGRVKAAFKDRKCIGALISGKYYLFPKLRSFNVYPPDLRSIFIGCIYVIPDYKKTGVEKRLLIELEKDLIREKVEAVEAIGKRMTDDIEEEEYENSPLISFKFLINNGFYIRKNDELFPLVRLDMKSIAFNSVKSSDRIEELGLKKQARSPVIIKQE